MVIGKTGLSDGSLTAAVTQYRPVFSNARDEQPEKMEFMFVVFDVSQLERLRMS